MCIDIYNMYIHTYMYVYIFPCDIYNIEWMCIYTHILPVILHLVSCS